MKLTKSQLKSIIKEELNKMVSEATPRIPPDVPDAPPEYVGEPEGEPAETDLPESPLQHQPTFSVYSYMSTEELKQLQSRIESQKSEEAMAEKAQIKHELAKREEANKPIRSTK